MICHQVSCDEYYDFFNGNLDSSSSQHLSLVEKKLILVHPELIRQYGQAKALSCLIDWFLTFSAAFKSELQAMISACRITRAYIDQVCYSLMSHAVVIMDVSIL